MRRQNLCKKQKNNKKKKLKPNLSVSASIYGYLTRVNSSPKKGQFRYLDDGILEFNSAEAGKELIISPRDKRCPVVKYRLAAMPAVEPDATAVLLRRNAIVSYSKLIDIGRELLIAIGENPNETRIKDTPVRFAKMWQEFIEYDPGKIDTAFDSNHTDQMVIISGMRVWSLCEHHLLPFYCHIAIGYIPKGKVLGLSKFARIAHAAAHKLQLQERLVQEIADEARKISGCKDVAVIATGEHLCMSMRGIKTEALMTSSVMYGAFRKEGSARAEFMQLADIRKR